MQALQLHVDSTCTLLRPNAPLSISSTYDVYAHSRHATDLHGLGFDRIPCANLWCIATHSVALAVGALATQAEHHRHGGPCSRVRRKASQFKVNCTPLRLYGTSTVGRYNADAKWANLIHRPQLSMPGFNCCKVAVEHNRTPLVHAPWTAFIAGDKASSVEAGASSGLKRTVRLGRAAWRKGEAWPCGGRLCPGTAEAEPGLPAQALALRTARQGRRETKSRTSRN